MSCLSQTASLTCPECKQTFQAETWLIVDAAERPELIEQIKDSTLHAIPCPHCGASVEADQPLLLYFPDQTPPLLFSPAQQTSAEEDAEHARQLLGWLRDSLGDAWRDEWLAQGLPAVPRALLPIALREGLEAAARQMAEQAQQELERLRREDPETYRQLEEVTRRAIEDASLLQSLQAFIQADTWAESRRVLEEHPELLTDEADSLLTQLANAARAQGDEDAVRFFEEHRALLRRCREVGIARAFAEKMLPPEALAAAEQAGLSPQQALEMARMLAQLPPEVRQVLEELARREPEIRSQEDFERALQAHPDLRQRLEEAQRARSESEKKFTHLLELQQQAEGRPELWPMVINEWETFLQEPDVLANSSLWGAAQGNLANACLRLFEISGDPVWAQKAETGLQAILDIFRRERAPAQWATVQHSLGNLFLDRYERSGEEAHAQAAQTHYQNVIDLGKEQPLAKIYPFRAAGGLVRLHFMRRAWPLVCRAYQSFRQAFEALWSAQLPPASRKSWLAEIQRLPAQVAFAQAQLGKIEEAIETLEWGRAQLLRENLERSRRDLERLKDLGQAALYERYQAAAQRYEALTRLAEAAPSTRTGIIGKQTPSRPPNWLEQMEQAQKELDEAVEAIRQVPGYEGFLRSLPAAEIQQQAAAAPLVYLAATPAGGLALLVRGESIRAIELPALTNDALQKQVIGEEGEASYLRAYLNWSADPYNSARRQAWQEALDRTTAWLWPTVMAPLLEALRQTLPPESPESQVALIPGGWLALLPLHAAWVADPTRPGGRRYALDEFTFTYTPSAQALRHARQQAQTVSADSLLVIEDPRGDLAAFSSPAAQTALAAFDSPRRTHLQGKQARLENVKEALPRHNVLFFFTHGEAAFGEPLQSQLLLHDEPLTLRELFNLKTDQSRLAILAACESGVPSDLQLLEEVISLPAGLMQAGVPSVVGTLWPVLAVSTSILITMFFDYWRKQGLAAPQALRRAQQTLRDAAHDPQAREYFKPYLPEAPAAALSPPEAADELHPHMLFKDFSPPFYWAAFTYTGV